MIAEAGLIALWFAAALSLLQLLLGALALRGGDAAVGQAVRPVAVAQAAAAMLAFTALILLFMRTDLSVLCSSGPVWLRSSAGM